jgi:hypothetical protein
MRETIAPCDPSVTLFIVMPDWMVLLGRRFLFCFAP